MSTALILGASSPRERKAHTMRGLVLWTTDTEATVTTDPNMTWGAGAPNHTAPANSIYVRTDAADSDTLLYRNTDSAATWEAVVGSEVADLLAADNAWTGTNDHSKSVTGTDELINSDLSINHATQVGVAVDATATQLTTARTGGSVAAFRGKTTSLAGDLNSVKYNTFEAAAPTDGGGTVLHQVLAQAAGYDVLIDLTQISSGEGDIVLKDNIADALTIREGANVYMTFVTSDGVEAINVFKAFTSTALGTFVGLTCTSTFTQSANILHTTTQAASGTGLSSTASMTDATGSAIAAKIAATQLTNAKTGGTSIGEEIDLTGLAGDTAGGTYLSQYLTVTANGGSAKYYARRLAAGFTAVDDFSLLNSGTAITLLKDNVAEAWALYEGTNAYIKCVTTNSSESVSIEKPLLINGGLAPGSRFTSTEQTGTGSSQNVAHGLGTTPSHVWWAVSDSGATGIYTLVPGVHDATNAKFTVTSGVKFYVFALK